MASRRRARKKAEVSSKESVVVSKETLAKVAAIRESTTTAVASYIDSSEEEEDEIESEKVVNTALSKYLQLLGNREEEERNARIITQPNSCLVCLSTVKRSEAVWSCRQCFCLFHLICVQQWARDGVKLQHGVLSQELFPNISRNWSCPKCREEFDVRSIPDVYTCFCGKHVDPPNDPWLLAHSCGELCDKPLPSACGHHCVSLCHPGPCPPCPRTVLMSCYCGRSQPVMKRCGANGWGCGHVCGRVLSCDLHTCEEKCHEGDCKGCTESIIVRCNCGRERKDRPCEQPSWSCDQVCGRGLSCGEHTCQQVCHSGECGECPRSGVRQCPCGKSKHVLPCTEDVPTCNDTCDKLLQCGSHRCSRSCHYGECGTCLQMSVKSCRCGKRSKSVPCSQDFLCESKCSKMRQCGRHQCKRKCCNGSCPSCEQVCGRTLGCKNHKCQAPCHLGQCYPCILNAQKACRCGATMITVICGRERHIKPPKCKQRCTIPPTCHHSHRQPHHCHFGGCPPCSLACGKHLACGHNCVVRCHSSSKTIPTKQTGLPLLGSLAQSNGQQVAIPCPPCQVMVSKGCKGGHEVVQVKCSECREFSCGRSCGRRLPCGNHTCERGCHVVVNPPSQLEAGEDCLLCERGCNKPREEGCVHPCPLPCHPGSCPPCEQLVKVRCHCDTMNMFIKCKEWCVADNQEKDRLQTCNSQCTKTLVCGHRCPLQCHSGGCASERECSRKVTLRCPCRRRKKEYRCSERSAVECDSECQRILLEKKQEEEREEEATRERERREAEEALERQQNTTTITKRRRRRGRNRTTEEDEESDDSHSFLPSWLSWKLGLVVLVLCLLAVLAYAATRVQFKIKH